MGISANNPQRVLVHIIEYFDKIVVVVQASGFSPWGVNPNLYQWSLVNLFPVIMISTSAYYFPSALDQLFEVFGKLSW